MLFNHDLEDRFAKGWIPGDYNALEGRFTEADKAQRERLEKTSAGADRAQRRNMADILNGEIRKCAVAGESGLEGIAKLRDKYQYPGGYRSAEQHNAAQERFAKSADGESFNRLVRGGSDFDFSGGRFERLGRSKVP